MSPETFKSRLKKPTTRKGKSFLKAREPKLVEEPRKALFLYGHKTSQLIKDVLSDFHKLKWQESVKYTKKNEDIRPFEAGGEAALEQFCKKMDCSLFVMGSHTKKRQHNLTFGRMYNHHCYDLVEFGVARFTSLEAFGSTKTHLGGKPCFVFLGEEFENSPHMKLAKELILDFFRGRSITKVNLNGVDRVVIATAPEPYKLVLTQCEVCLKKSVEKGGPRVQLREIGPHINFEVRRVRYPPKELEREAHKSPPAKKKVKNVTVDSMQNKIGRMYVPKQNLDSIALSKPKGMKRKQKESLQGKQGNKRGKGMQERIQ